MKNITTINFKLKQNQLPKNCLNTLEQNIDLSSAVRVLSADERYNQEFGNVPNMPFSEEGFNEVYQKMDGLEQDLYRLWSIQVEKQDISKVMEQLAEHPDVEFAEIDELNSLYHQPNDPLYPQMWGLQKIDSECGWDSDQGKDTVVAVLDTGVNYNHPDISSNMWSDSNGKYGYDFSDNDSDPMDYHGHGTHVAGTVAATGDNGIGVIGVAPKTKIMAVKIFPNATDSNIVRALKYAIDNGAKILNNSWGPSSRRPSAPALEAAIDYVHSKGGICIFAAGNRNDDTQYYSPANMTKTIAVGATDQSDSRAGFSNWGSEVDLAAPGVDILSLKFNDNNYREMSGTSMACPHVAGAAAMLLSKEPHLDFQQVRDKLVASSDAIVTDKPVGDRRLNVCPLVSQSTT